METAQSTNSRLDMLHGPIWNRIPRFALPIAATAIPGQLFNAADIAVVGNFTGDLRTVSVAAVSAVILYRCLRRTDLPVRVDPKAFRIDGDSMKRILRIGLPAGLTMTGVCGVRLSWIHWVFPKSPTFQTIMVAFPISLAAAALLMLIAVLCCRPSRRFATEDGGEDLPQ